MTTALEARAAEVLETGASVVWAPESGATVRAHIAFVVGRGEHPGVYERLGRRLAFDGYRVHVVDVSAERDSGDLVAVARHASDDGLPVFLAGSDVGALHALALARVADFGTAPAGVLLAGVPSVTGISSVAESSSVAEAPNVAGSPSVRWDDELDVRTACPVHRTRLTGDVDFVRGGLSDPLPETLLGVVREIEDLGIPTLLVHGAADTVAPVEDARRLAARLHAEIAIVAGGRHDVLNDLQHRSVAAYVVGWLEWLRAGRHTPPILAVERPVVARSEFQRSLEWSVETRWEDFQ